MQCRSSLHYFASDEQTRAMFQMLCYSRVRAKILVSKAAPAPSQMLDITKRRGAARLPTRVVDMQKAMTRLWGLRVWTLETQPTRELQDNPVPADKPDCLSAAAEQVTEVRGGWGTIESLAAEGNLGFMVPQISLDWSISVKS